MASSAKPPTASPRTQALGSQAGGNGQVRRPASRLARQRRPGWIAAGVALLALAVLANVYLFQTSSHRVSVVRVARDVGIGQQITRADLATSLVALGPGVQMIPGRQLGEVVGRHAAVDLRSGTLLTASQVTTQLTPRPGQALVTVAVKPSQLPPGGLAPGSQVRIVSTPGTQGQNTPAQTGPGQGAQTSVKDVAATVDAVGGPDADGTQAVAVLVADADSSAVARQASTGQIALVITTRGG
jgi:hypothetical protein